MDDYDRPDIEGITKGLMSREVARHLEKLFPNRPQMQALYFRTKIAPYLLGLKDETDYAFRIPGMFNQLRESGYGPHYEF